MGNTYIFAAEIQPTPSNGEPVKSPSTETSSYLGLTHKTIYFGVKEVNYSDEYQREYTTVWIIVEGYHSLEFDLPNKFEI